MKLSIKKIIMTLILATVLVSCSQGESLQSYFVYNQEKADFMSLDVPVSMLNLDESQLTNDQLKAYKSIDKLNMLAFRKTEQNDSIYSKELAQVKIILKNPDYQELMRGGNSTDGKFLIKYLGEEDSIKELIVFGNANDKGFLIVRVLGDEMNPADIMKLEAVIKNINPDYTNLKQFSEFFK